MVWGNNEDVIKEGNKVYDCFAFHHPICEELWEKQQDVGKSVFMKNAWKQSFLSIFLNILASLEKS